MIHDAAMPPGIRPAVATVERAGVCYSSARWTPDALWWLSRELRTRGRDALARVPTGVLLDAWSETVEAFLDPDSRERRALEPALERLCRLSNAGLQAGLEAVLGGVRRAPATRLSSDAEPWARAELDNSLVLVILASNLPALAVQPLLPALLLRRPVLLKSPSSEPLFAPAFVDSLTRRLAELAPALAAIAWQGGDTSLEEPLLEASDRVLAYGEDETLADLARRAPDKLFAYGPKTSVAVVGAEVDPTEVVAGLARDVALFDQRGCLSIQAIFTAGDPSRLAHLLAAELQRLAGEWPPGGVDPVAAAGVQQLRSDATLRGLISPELPLRAGTVVVEPQLGFQPSPGLRSVRIHPVTELDRVPEALADWSGRLQGAALAGASAWSLMADLRALEISRCAPPGELQTPDAAWNNGGVHPFTALTGEELSSLTRSSD